MRRRGFAHDLASDHRARLISRKYDIKQHFPIWLWIFFVLQGMHFEAFGTCVWQWHIERESQQVFEQRR